MEKLPPIEKIFEAWTAIADGRVSLHENSAEVASSDGSKGYTVRFDGDRFSSDDNATYWRGYPGYPVIAVLMLQGRLPLYKAEADLWRNVNWKEVNTKYKNNYAKAVEEVATSREINLPVAYKEAERVMDALRSLDLTVKRKI